MRWPDTITIREAMALQESLRTHVVRRDDFAVLGRVAGADVSIQGDAARAAVCVFSWPDLEPLESSVAVQRLEFPYVPGLLAFREVPSLREAFRGLRTAPDLALVDGLGIAHPRRLGIASQLGVELDLPTIGVGKSRLIGEHREPGARRGSRAALRDEGETIGCALRTRDGVRVLFVSIGHRVSLPTAVRIVLRAAPRYRLPEPIRAAHALAGAWT